MPGTARRKIAPRRISIPDSAADAWRRGHYRDLHRALGLHPFERSPFPLTVTPLGCDPDQPPSGDSDTLWDESWQRAIELQQALYELAGPPGSSR